MSPLRGQQRGRRSAMKRFVDPDDAQDGDDVIVQESGGRQPESSLGEGERERNQCAGVFVAMQRGSMPIRPARSTVT